MNQRAPLPPAAPPPSGFSVAFDPLDGSSIVDTNFSVSWLVLLFKCGR